jgi:hypothetical protein
MVSENSSKIFITTILIWFKPYIHQTSSIIKKKLFYVKLSLQMISRYIASCHQSASLFLLKSTTYEREMLSAND